MAYSVDRELILNTLLSYLKTVPGLVTVQRQLQLWDAFPDIRQPALCQVEHSEEEEPRGRGLPPKIKLEVKLYVYIKTPNGNGGTLINQLLAAIVAALPLDDRDQTVCTLGGLVNRVWIEGKILKDPGDLDQQAIFIVPLFILLP